MQRLTVKQDGINTVIIDGIDAVQVPDMICGVSYVCKGSVVDKLSAFEDVMNEYGFNDIDELKKMLNIRFIAIPKHLGREINGVYFNNEQCRVLSQYNEFNISYLKKYKESQYENQSLKHAWQELKYFIQREHEKDIKRSDKTHLAYVLAESAILSQITNLEKKYNIKSGGITCVENL